MVRTLKELAIPIPMAPAIDLKKQHHESLESEVEQWLKAGNTITNLKGFEARLHGPESIRRLQIKHLPLKEQILKLRRYGGINYAQMGKLIGSTHQGITKVMNGADRAPDEDFLLRLRDAALKLCGLTMSMVD